MAGDENSPLAEHSTSSVHSGEELEHLDAAKDSSRTKRKKARRACLACQRAHLTCGDERPCLRCKKRGLAESCHDGMRKKAKYLHDAPNEALEPGAASKYMQSGKGFNVVGDHKIKDSSDRPNDDDHIDVGPSRPLRFTASLSNAPQNSSQLTGTTRRSALQDQSHRVSQLSEQNGLAVPSFDANFFDPTDQSLFNFDLASMNFGNHYGALEFGMLGHLSSAANDNLVPAGGHRHSSTPYESVNLGTSMYLDNMNDASAFGFSINGSLTDWQANPSGHGLQMNSWNHGINPEASFRHQSYGEPYAYAIGAVSNDIPEMSPNSTGIDKLTPSDRNYADMPLFSTPQRQNEEKRYSYQHMLPTPSSGQARVNGPSEAIATRLGNLPTASAAMRRRRRDPSTIYSSVTKPYPYTLGFHALTAYLQRRFSSQKRLAIAQALASIRPSFISCTRTLMDDDLIFMEKCFQRQLVEYEDFIGACGTPTIVCRRTGEVAYAGKEFSLLTGWAKDVLLGKAPNLNVNGYSPSGSMTAASSRTGMNTPHGSADPPRSEVVEALQPARPQAVFLAELLDDDSVVQFYEDFAKLAFADSKGSAWCACKLLKYKVKDEHATALDNSGLGSNVDGKVDAFLGAKRDRSTDPGGKTAITPHRQRNKNNVECMYCWTVRRDVFDIPMMIVINFLPVI